MKNKVSFKHIIKLAIPAIIAGIAEPLLSITDTAFIGNIQQHPTESLAAVGIAGSFIAAITWILAQTRSAITAIVSQYLGANKLSKIQSLPAQIILFNFIVSLILYFLTVFFIKEIFKLYNADGKILNLAVEYYNIRAIGLPFTLFTFSVFGVFRGLQNTFTPMVISITGMLINIILDYILIFGIEGVLPPLHVKGAAYASVIAQIIMAIISIVYYLKKTPFQLKISFKINPEFKRIIFLSANLFIRTLSLNLALYLANAYATKYGKSYIAAQTIVFQIWLFFAFFIDGFSSVGNIVSGKLLGEKNYRKMFLLSKTLIKYTIFIALILGAICFVFYYQIGQIFTKDKEVLNLFYSIFWIVILMQPINAIAFIFDGIFKGLAEAVTLRNVLLFATFLGFVPALLISDYFNLKLQGIWIAFTVWMGLRALLLYVKFKIKYVKTI
jgi:putative MATE family efflux protein